MKKSMQEKYLSAQLTEIRLEKQLKSYKKRTQSLKKQFEALGQQPLKTVKLTDAGGNEYEFQVRCEPEYYDRLKIGYKDVYLAEPSINSEMIKNYYIKLPMQPKSSLTQEGRIKYARYISVSVSPFLIKPRSLNNSLRVKIESMKLLKQVQKIPAGEEEMSDTRWHP